MFGPIPVTTMALNEQQLAALAEALKAAVDSGKPLTAKQAAEFDAPGMAAVREGKII
jgi:hypothetical protein